MRYLSSKMWQFYDFDAKIAPEMKKKVGKIDRDRKRFSLLFEDCTRFYERDH